MIDKNIEKHNQFHFFCIYCLCRSTLITSYKLGTITINDLLDQKTKNVAKDQRYEQHFCLKVQQVLH